MAEYIKQCPRCDYDNPDTAKLCERDHEPLNDVDAKPRAAAGAAAAAAAHAACDEPPETVTADNPAPLQAGKKAAPTPVTHAHTATLAVRVQASGEPYPIRSGQTLGQAHPTSTAAVQITEERGSKFIHRQHCRFDYDGSRWRITAIDQAALGRMIQNATLVGGQPLAPGESCPVAHGDRLELGPVTFNIELTEAST